MESFMFTSLRLFVLTTMFLTSPLLAQNQEPPKKKPKKPAPFQWVNPLPQNVHPRVQHRTFESDANKTKVGYAILLPKQYDKSPNKKFPVVYWLHGGRPGGEHKSVSMAPYFDKAMSSGKVPAMIYVFPNGGKLSHYDHGDSKGETAFLELIKHIDSTYRTIDARSGRAIEGFSQGGRGTGRYMFKHANLFCSAAPMGGGHQHEKRISENNGVESEHVTIVPATNNTWDLAKRYSMSDTHRLRILIVVGDKGFNFETNKEWHAHLDALDIEHEFVIAPDVPHSSRKVYDVLGTKVMDFHVESFRQSGAIQAASK